MGGIKWIRAYPVQSGVDSFKPSTQADIKWNRGEGKAQIVYQPSPEDQSNFSQDGKNLRYTQGSMDRKAGQRGPSDPVRGSLDIPLVQICSSETRTLEQPVYIIRTFTVVSLMHS